MLKTPKEMFLLQYRGLFLPRSLNGTIDDQNCEPEHVKNYDILSILK